ncbi:prepilin-type N-terminal cleavage/methylation domain-containing protein [Ahniella affigens]|nr:prepilin-type N-terminal cleavage/methylation domain-containing protein [Ahniella affigens]
MSNIAIKVKRLRGFTLVEMLVATLLLALLMAGTYSGISAARRAATSGEDLIDRTNRVRVAQEFLRRQLRSALALNFQVEDTTGEVRMFEGERDYMRFVATMPGHMSRGGAYVQELTIEPGKGGERLVFRHQMLNGFDPDNPESERDPVVLIEGIERGSFEFIGLDETGKLEDWSETWKNTAVLPLAVRIKFRMTDESRYIWPVIEVPLLVNASAVSGWDSFYGRPVQ